MESFKIKLITYNVGDKSSDENKPDELFDFAQLKEFDFIFIGLQEITEDSSWTGLIKTCFGQHDYVLVKVRSLWAIWLYSLVKRSRLADVDSVESEVKASGYANIMGNKGGVSIRFKYQGISLVVINAHLTAHESEFQERLSDYIDIVTAQTFRDKEVSNVLDHNIVFWMGDLNFRIEELEKDDVEKLIKSKNFSTIVQYDQLKKAIAHHNIFNNFKEGELNFPPTYKFDDNSDDYDTSKKQRKPAWTDRILYTAHNDNHIHNITIKQLGYYSEQNIRGSDHRPVCAEFEISFNHQDHHYLPIEFLNLPKVWKHDHDQVVEYRSLVKTEEHKSHKHDKIESHNSNLFKPDSCDWIALVPSTWIILADDLITYVYNTCTSENDISVKASVEFSKKYFHSVAHHTQLQLVYFSKRKNCIQGISSVFSIE